MRVRNRTRTKFVKSYQGPSLDHRTNRWKLTCGKCKYTWEPSTTMLGHRVETCEKCGREELVNYNEDESTEKRNVLGGIMPQRTTGRE